MATEDSSQDWFERWKKAAADAEAAITAAQSPDQLEAMRIHWLGRSGVLNDLMKDLPKLPADKKREWGGPANQGKGRILAILDDRRAGFERAKLEGELSQSNIDATLPPPPAPRGRLHPLTLVMDEMNSILARLGFALADGPLVESEYYNFGALNIPPEHPARDTQDTFYLESPSPLVGVAAPGRGGGMSNLLLRTHTSPVQIRRMESSRPPIRIIAPGRVFRHEAVDASHSAVFHQVEGLYVDKQVSMADLRGTLDTFLQCLFGPQTKTRFRPSYFPFTEPSAEVDIACILCGGSGCAACKRSGWMEILGCGLVHPNVFKAVGYNPDTWSGFAFGMGVERIAMLKLGITDIRMFYENDLRFLEQWG